MKTCLKILCVIFVLMVLPGFGPIGVSNLGTGLDLVTDGVFEAHTASNSYTSDFSAGEDGWTGSNGTAAGNIDGIGALNDNLRFTIDGANTAHYLRLGTPAFTVGKTVRVRFDYYIPPGQSNIDQIRFRLGVYGDIETTLDAWTAVDWYVIASATQFRVYAYDGGQEIFQDAGSDDVFYIRNVIIDAVTFTSWTDTADGLAPGTDGAGALTNKAAWDGSQAAASTLTQSGILWPGGTHTFVITTTRSAGSLTPKCGSTSGTARSSADTFTEQTVCAGSDLGFEADAAFIGTLDTVTVRKF